MVPTLLGRLMMKKWILYFVIAILFLASETFAHSGRVDSCGGHKNRKSGDYHIHNYSKYCSCYPKAPECKKDTQGDENKNDGNLSPSKKP